MNYLSEFLTVAAVHILAAASPGPDFFLVLKNSLGGSRKDGLYTAIGIAMGIPVHVTYCLLGIGLLISKSILVFSIIKLLGAVYLVYIGIKTLRSKPSEMSVVAPIRGASAGFLVQASAGFLTNVLNPKATLFFLALFTQVVDSTTPKAVQLVYGLEMTAATFLWFGVVALSVSYPRIRARFLSLRHILDRIFGSILIILGIKVALSSK